MNFDPDLTYKLIEAAKHNDDHVIKHAESQNLLKNVDLLYVVGYIIENDNFKLLKWLGNRHNLPKSETFTTTAAKNKNYEMFEWLLKKNFSLPYVTGGVNYIINDKKFEYLCNKYDPKWMHSFNYYPSLMR